MHQARAEELREQKKVEDLARRWASPPVDPNAPIVPPRTSSHAYRELVDSVRGEAQQETEQRNKTAKDLWNV